MTPDLSDLHDDQLRQLLRSLLEPALANGRGAFDMFHPIRYAIAAELRQRGQDSDAVRLIVDHGGHEVWTHSDDGTVWSVMCDCSWAVNHLPSSEEADRQGEQHISESGGRWEPSTQAA